MKGVLLLHGLSSHPVLNLKPLAEGLKALGYAVAQPTLPGHGTRPEDLLRVRWPDWYEKAKEAYDALPAPKGVAGLSMGGLLAARLAAEETPAFLVALVPALGLAHPLAFLAPYLHPLLPKAPPTRAVSDPSRPNPNYPWIPTRAVGELVKLSRAVTPLLPRVQAPALVVGASRDSTVPKRAVERFYTLLGSEDKTLRFYDSEHDLLLDKRAEEVVADALAWIQAHL